jgi:hypothetical protein
VSLITTGSRKSDYRLRVEWLLSDTEDSNYDLIRDLEDLHLRSANTDRSIKTKATGRIITASTPCSINRVEGLLFCRDLFLFEWFGGSLCIDLAARSKRGA